MNPLAGRGVINRDFDSAAAFSIAPAHRHSKAQEGISKCPGFHLEPRALDTVPA